MNAYRQWECPNCWEPHRDILSAQTCCEPRLLDEWVCDECEAELKELQKDQERLEYLLTRECAELRTKPTAYRLAIFQAVYSSGSWLCLGAYEGITPREAIDKAMQGEG